MFDTINIGMNRLISDWQQKEMIDQQQVEKIENFVEERRKAPEQPIYIRIIIAGAVLVATLCMVAFLAMIHLIDFKSSVNLIFWGMFFTVSAIAIKRMKEDEGILKDNFRDLFSFIAMALGKIYLFYVMSDLLAKYISIEAAIAISAFIITLVTYNLYKVSLDRLLSTFVVFLTFTFFLIKNASLASVRPILMDIYIIFHIGLIIILHTYPRIKQNYMPIAYTVVLSLGFMTLCYYDESAKLYYHPMIIKTAFILLQIYVIGWAAGNSWELKKEPLIIAIILTMIFGIITSPGVMLAISLMILGYGKHDKCLLQLGTILMPIFIILYYYNLNITLLAKSGVLIGSGLVLLIGYSYMKMRKFDRGVIV